MSQLTQTGWQIFVEVPGKAPIELPNGESVIGRSRACTVQIAETTVSRQHAIFVVEPGKVKLRDLGSSNGTFVNGQRVDGEMPLTDGDRVVVGEAEIVLRVLAPLGPAEATAKMVIPPLTQAPPAQPSPNTPPIPQSPPSSPVWQAPAQQTPPPSLAWQAPAQHTPPPIAAPSPVFGASYSPPPASASREGQSALSSSSSSSMPTPTPISRPTPAVAPPPAPTPAPMPVPRMPSAAKIPGSAAPAEPETKGDEMLSSIRDIDLAPVPPPVPQRKVTVIDKAEPAGFWLRVVAALLDSIPLALLGAIPIFVQIFLSPSIGSLLLVLAPAYALLVFLVLPATWGTTPGKRLMKLAIVSESTVPGQGLGWGTAALRLVGYLVCSLTFGLGYLLVAFSARKQGLHDLIAKTNVVRKR